MATTMTSTIRQEPPGQAAPMTHRKIMEALSGLLLGMFVSILSSTVVSNALPTITAALHADETTYTWVITSSLLATTVATPIWGKLADLVSKKVLVQLGLIVFVLGSAIAGLSQNSAMLIGARVIQGIGAGGLTALSQVIMAAMIAPRDRGRYSGYLGAVFALATIGGPLIGGVIVDTSWLGWRWCFYVGVPFAIIALIVLQKTLHLPDLKRQVTIDWTGAVLISAAVSLLLVWVSFAGNKYDWLSWQTAAMVGGALVLSVLFLLTETRAKEPIVPLRLFRVRTISLAVAASVLVGVAMYGATTFLSQYFQLARGETPTKAGLMTLPLILGLALASTIAGRIITKTGRWKAILVIGTFLLTLGFAFMGSLRFDTDYWLSAVYMFFIGVGLGMTQQNLVLAVQNQVRAEELGAGSAIVAFFRSLGGAIGVSVLGAVVVNRVTRYMTDGLSALGVHGSAKGDGAIPTLSSLPAPIRTVVQGAYGHGVGDVFMYAAPIAAIALVTVLFIKEVPLRRDAGGTTDEQPQGGTDPALGRHAQRPANAPTAGTLADGLATTTTREIPSAISEVGTRPGTAAVDTPARWNGPWGGVEIRGVVSGEDGFAVGHATMTLIDVRGHQLGRTLTRADGGYSLSAPGAGTYVLIASAVDRDPQVATLVAGDRAVDFDMVLRGSGTLAGTVRDPKGAPVGGAAVVLSDVRGEVVTSGTTGADGGFGFAGVPAGTYTLAVSAGSFQPVAVPVEVIGTGETRHDVELSPGGSVRGTIRVRNGRPLGEARVTLLDGEGNVVASTMTGDDGEYAFADLTGGRYTVIAAGYPPVAETLTLDGRGTDAHDLWLSHPE